MKYLAIEYKAVKEIVSSSHLQTSDYREGSILAQTIIDKKNKVFSSNLKLITSTNGCFIISSNIDSSKFLIFDLEHFNGFNKNKHRIITIIQKICRVSIKLWDNISGFSSRERHKQGTSKMVIFPLNYTTQKNPYKILLEKHPDSKRQNKRGTKHLLVFWDGNDAFEAEPSLSTMRKVEPEFQKIKENEKLIKKQILTKKNSYIDIKDTTSLEKRITPHMGLEYWRHNLTQKQKDFVFSKSLGPDILKGAAGTGKTLSLVLRCINQLSTYKNEGNDIKNVLFTHSIATKELIEEVFISNGGGEFLDSTSSQNVHITTLQEWCINNLGNRISNTEYLDKDALESKNTQLLYICDACEEFLDEDYKTSKKLISKDLYDFFEENDSWDLTTYIQNEISTYIKGRAGEVFETYCLLSRSKTAIPLSTEDDFKTIFHIFNKYQENLIKLNLFDSDDITISALQETNTPIWRRRRLKDGFDVLYIDETHLFNENELNLFHNLLKQKATNIIFTIDRSQASGDISISSKDIAHSFSNKSKKEEYGLKTIFRSSSEIIDLASCILASGSSIFSNIENPLLNSSEGFVKTNNEKCTTPYFIKCKGSDYIFEKTFNEVDNITKTLNKRKSDVLIIPANDKLFDALKKYTEKKSILARMIEHRGDISSVKHAEKNSEYIIGGMDYIGGLEFSAVIIVGIDKDNFPPKFTKSGETSHYLLYSSFNRLYVAITRAKCLVAFLYDETQGISDILSTAVEEKLIIEVK